MNPIIIVYPTQLIPFYWVKPQIQENWVKPKENTKEEKTKEKKPCPYCGKNILHVKRHIEYNHSRKNTENEPNENEKKTSPVSNM